MGACPGLSSPATVRRLPEGRIVAVRALPIADPPPRRAAVPSLRSGAAIGAKGLQLPGAAQVVEPPALRGRLRGTHRARGAAVQVRGLAPVGGSPGPAGGGTA